MRYDGIYLGAFTGWLLALIVAFLILLMGCGNPLSGGDDREERVSVRIEMQKSGYRAKVYADGLLGSIVEMRGECDTIMVRKGAHLKARVYRFSDRRYTVQDTVADRYIDWILP